MIYNQILTLLTTILGLITLQQMQYLALNNPSITTLTILREGIEKLTHPKIDSIINRLTVNPKPRPNPCNNSSPFFLVKTNPYCFHQ